MSKLFYPVARVLPFLGAALCFVFLSATAQAADIKVEARLIWATNIKTNVHHKAAGPEIERRFAAFKWGNYYEITNRVATVSENVTESLQMSRKCLIKIKNMGGSRIEVSCYGGGNFLSKGDYSLSSGKWFTLAGPDRNDSAWFIVLRLKDEKDDAKGALLNIEGKSPRDSLKFCL